MSQLFSFLFYPIFSLLNAGCIPVNDFSIIEKIGKGNSYRKMKRSSDETHTQTMEA